MLFAALVLLVFAPASLVFAECPFNTVYCEGNDCCQAGVVFDVHRSSTDPANGVSFGTSTALYNLVAGTLTAVANVVEAYRHVSGVTAVDLYTMSGIAATTVKVRLSLTWATVTDPSGRMAWTSGYARLQTAGQTTEANSLGPNMDPNIELDIAVTEGVPFTVTCEVIAAGWGYYPKAEVTARLSFIGLPEAARITSCNGYGSTSVPVEHTTWGGIKSLYR